MFSACRSSILTAVLSGTWHGVSRLCRESSRFWVWFWVIFLFTASWLSFSIMASVETVCCVERHFIVNSSSFTNKKKKKLKVQWDCTKLWNSLSETGWLLLNNRFFYIFIYYILINLFKILLTLQLFRPKAHQEFWKNISYRI